MFIVSYRYFFYGVFVKDVFLQEPQLLPVFNVTFPGVDDV